MVRVHYYVCLGLVFLFAASSIANADGFLEKLKDQLETNHEQQNFSTEDVTLIASVTDKNIDHGAAKHRILGTWYSTDGWMAEFRDDGLVIVRSPGRPNSAPGRYEVLSEDQLRLRLSGGDRERTLSFSMDQYELILSDRWGDQWWFFRSSNSVRNDFAVLEGIRLAAGARAAVAEFYNDNSRFPVSNADAGLAEPNKISGRDVSSIELGPSMGSITIRYGNSSDKLLASNIVRLVPIAGPGKQLSWACETSKPIWPFVKSACRNPITDVLAEVGQNNTLGTIDEGAQQSEEGEGRRTRRR